MKNNILAIFAILLILPLSSAEVIPHVDSENSRNDIILASGYVYIGLDFGVLGYSKIAMGTDPILSFYSKEKVKISVFTTYSDKSKDLIVKVSCSDLNDDSNLQSTIAEINFKSYLLNKINNLNKPLVVLQEEKKDKETEVIWIKNGVDIQRKSILKVGVEDVTIVVVSADDKKLADQFSAVSKLYPLWEGLYPEIKEKPPLEVE